MDPHARLGMQEQIIKGIFNAVTCNNKKAHMNRRQELGNKRVENTHTMREDTTTDKGRLRQ